MFWHHKVVLAYSERSGHIRHREMALARPTVVIVVNVDTGGPRSGEGGEVERHLPRAPQSTSDSQFK